MPPRRRARRPPRSRSPPRSSPWTLWSSAFVGIRDAGRAIGAGPLTLGRLVVAAAVLGAVVAVRREALPPRAVIGAATSERGVSAGGGAALCIAAALAYAGGVVAQKPLLERRSGLQVTFLGCAVAAVACPTRRASSTTSGRRARGRSRGPCTWAPSRPRSGSRPGPALALAGDALCLAGVVLARRR